MSRNGEKVTEKDLFPILKAEIKEKSTGALLMSYLTKISEEAESFAEIIGRPKTKTPVSIQRELGFINAYGFRISNTVLLAIWTATKDEKTRLIVLRDIKRFLVKYAIFGGQVTNKLETTLANVSFEIRKDLSTGLDKMKDSLARTLHLKEIIKAGFSVLEPTISVGRALLSEIELYLAGTEKPPGDSKQVHVEHIFPQSPTTQWLKLFNAEKGTEESYLGRLGNMTLLDQLLNKQCGNKPFSEKQSEYYHQSDFRITKDLLKLETWTAASVEKRQNELYAHACKIWTI